MTRAEEIEMARAQSKQAEAIYAEIDKAWEQVGLTKTRISQTRNYRAAYNALAELGWVGPEDEIGDLAQAYRSLDWPTLVHIVSHCAMWRSRTGGAHSLEHAELQREMQRVVLSALNMAPGGPKSLKWSGVRDGSTRRSTPPNLPPSTR